MVDEGMLEYFKQLLGYSDAHWELWKSDPRNLKVLENAPAILGYRIVAEVTSSYGCAVGHKVGDKIIYGGDGTLLCQESPARVCVGIITPVNTMVSAITDKIFDGEDPIKLAFNKVHCLDVGPEHGGWGEVVVEVTVEKTQG